MINKYKLQRTVEKWIGKLAEEWLTIAVIIAFIIMLITAFTIDVHTQ